MKKNISKCIFFVAIAFCVLVILCVFNKEKILSLQSRKDKIIKKVENQIQRKEKIATKIIDDLFDKSIKNVPVDLFSNDRLLQISKEEGITFLKYENDSLVFWSDNFLPARHFVETDLRAKKLLKKDNGWYYVLKKEKNDEFCAAAILIKNNYNYQNDYLQNKFNIAFGTEIPGVDISEKTDQNVIQNSKGESIFSLTFDDNLAYTLAQQVSVLVLYFLAFICLLYLLFLVFRYFYQKRKISKTFMVLGVVFSMVLVRSILFYFRLPAAVYKTEIFGPIYYASSSLLPSFGDLLINTILFFIIAVFVYKNAPLNKHSVVKNWQKFLAVAAIVVFVTLLFLYIIKLIQSVITDSTISYNLDQLFSINGLSITGLIIISLLIFSCFLLSAVLFNYCLGLKIRPIYILVPVILFAIVACAANFLQLIECWPATLCFILFCTVYFLFRKKNLQQIPYLEIIAYLLIFTFATYYTLNVTTRSKELEKRISLAHKISSGEDPLAENMFKDIRKQIGNDVTLLTKLAAYPQGESEIREYLTKKYFSGYWDKYKVQITVCNPKDSLLLEAMAEKQNCKLFFDNLVKNYGEMASCPDLYLLNYGTGGNNYLASIDFMIDSSLLHLFIELNSKFIPKGLGYPELLIDKKLFINTDLSNYSYAKYYKNNLIDAYGKYYYSRDYTIDSALFVNDVYFFDYKGYNHLCYKSDDSSVVWVSKKNRNLLDIVAPFSILFILFTILVLLYYVFDKIIPGRKNLSLNFKNRLQLSMVSIILISFMIIGVSTFYFIRNLNDNKNIDQLNEKSMSILIEIQNKIGNNETLDEEQLAYFNGLLVKFSNIFFTDINVFDARGFLAATSRPQIFSEGLLSDRMNPTAFNRLSGENKTTFIHKENIGDLKYYSAYVPFFGINNNVLYYINLPYFAKESELNRELSSFLSAFINIYVVFIALTIIIALLTGSRITRPLNVIREKIRNVKLEKKNEKIVWERNDEIGGLISEYNRMIDELAESAEKLSRSERESAWRVMAMQVAHEIKNPLTPMKLSIQHLEKSWKDKAPDWDEKLERVTKNIIEQIDNLSAIASEFSYFAKMPKPVNEKINLSDLLTNSVSIFMANTHIDILFEKSKIPRDCFVFADRNQIIRVMNNVLTNAIQAIGKDQNGFIEIELNKLENKAIVIVRDNGSGISEEMKPRIFTPNFSTKSEGMGLGLAIVKAIIENSGGKIGFESEEKKGTTFYIELPLYFE
ncbi:MAG TPA: ATP-binding protein [Bacteroidales bacterium]|nr:ATP-binding protein [Bacteroidales bacterium]